MYPAQPNNLTCPHCHQIDQVAKVSAVFSGGAAAGAFAVSAPRGGYARVGGVSQTVQSMRLAPPQKPVYKNVWGVGYIIGLFLLTVVLLFSLPNAIISVLDVVSQVVYYNEYNLANTIINLVISIGLATGLVIGIVLLLSNRRKASSRQKAVIPTQHAQWERAMAKWQQLYYCGRCDGVFIPGGMSGLIPVGSMMAYLYS